jgi:hypothetical protein
MRQYVDAAAPAPPVARPRPAVTESLRAQIAAPVTKPAVTKPSIVTVTEPVTEPSIVTKAPIVTKPKRGGRPPIGPTAMTARERQARRRAKLKVNGAADRAALAPA